MKNLTLSNRQFFVYSIVIFLLFILLIKIFYTQIIQHGKYEILASNNYQIKEIIVPERGLIYDRNEILLVKNDSLIDLMITPSKLTINDKSEIIKFCKYFEIIDSTKINRRD